VNYEEVAQGNWRRALSEIDLLAHITTGWPESAVNRAYYAAFHAATALFAHEGVTFKSHGAIKAAVHRDLVHSGRWPKEHGALFNQLFELRSTGDYGGEISVTQEDAALALTWARRLVEAVHLIHPDVFPLADSEDAT
jgi:uncharacterized protein (UPF0332 family)